MSDFIGLYQQRLKLQQAVFTRIAHVDAMVAIVYRVMTSSGIPLVLKICVRPEDYQHEVHFLNHFAGKLPVPGILDVVEPEEGIHGAILMECLSGSHPEKTELSKQTAYDSGSLLAQIHLETQAGYGDLIQPTSLNQDSHAFFTFKFEEGFAECGHNLPKKLLEQCRQYFENHSSLLDLVDGPRIIHRDFRPGNILVLNGKIQGIIDWSSARSGFAEEDFCPLEQGEWTIHDAVRHSFLKGYFSIRPVPDYNTIMPLLTLSRTFATLGFIIRQGLWQTSHACLYQTCRRFLETFI